jgi:tetratricopeptide (TPR) repeat protein
MLSHLRTRTDTRVKTHAQIQVHFCAAALLCLAVSGYACGPFFPNRLTAEGDGAVLRTPVGCFESEIARIQLPGLSEFKAVSAEGDYRTQTTDADIDDLAQALIDRHVPESQRTTIIRQIRTIRGQLVAHGNQMNTWRHDSGDTSQSDLSLKRVLDLPPIPKGLPSEFSDYLQGAILYRTGDKAKAISTWHGLLQRPRKQRHYRSTWAAFMIGKSVLTSDPARSIESFEYVRQLARDGFRDSLGLAASSLGWQARVHLNQRQFDKAIELYLVQFVSGGSTAPTSLRLASSAALRAGPKALQAVAKNERTRRVLTAYVISRGGRFYSPPADIAQEWLAAIEAASVPLAHEADRLAWAAYQAGHIEMARRWLAISPEDSDMAGWIRAKVLLREGKIEEATQQLAQLVRRFPTTSAPLRLHELDDLSVSYRPGTDSMARRVRGELGVLKLVRRQYVESLDALLQGGFWEDAAYVAERVLSADELKRYVDRACPTAAPDLSPGADANARSRQCDDIRYLLARRLTRSGRWKEARPYYPAPWQFRLDAYIQAIRKGHDKTYSQSERAAFLWDAASRARKDGMELLGTEVAPDWFVHEGRYVRHPVSDVRGQAGTDKVTASSLDERSRLQQTQVAPNARFHYRYVAASHAWQATQLMPDRSADTAYKLCLAGSWLKDGDPQAADRFYKALVNRCGNTELGKEADRIRWFPKLND